MKLRCDSIIKMDLLSLGTDRGKVACYNGTWRIINVAIVIKTLKASEHIIVE